MMMVLAQLRGQTWGRQRLEWRVLLFKEAAGPMNKPYSQ